MDVLLTSVFWIAVGLLFHTFAGYAAIIHVLGRLRIRRSPAPRPVPGPAPPPTVSVVLVVRNESERLEARVRNLLDTAHPRDALEIIVVSDGSTDDPAARLRSLEGQGVRLLENARHRGKPTCLNEGVAAACGELVVFADARQRFTPDTIPALVASFDSPQVGAVSGELFISDSSGGVATGVGVYWRLEKAIRLGESRIDSSIGCTGAIYAIRRAAFEPLPADTLLDDVVCPMRITLKGLRVLFQPTAVAFDPQALDPVTERRRKRRTLAGNFQMLFRHPGWLLPWRNRLVAQLVSHKYLRLAAPCLLALALLSSALMAWRGSAFFSIATIAQLLLYLLAWVGIVRPATQCRLLAIPAAFVFLNWMTVLGFIDFLTRRHKVGW